MTTYRFGPIHFEFDDRRFRSFITGLKARLRHWDTPIPEGEIPDGWHLSDSAHPDGDWAHGWLSTTDYWVAIWREDILGAHITIKPRGDGWYVDYDPENSWMGGDLLGPKFESYERAVEVAVDAAERLSNDEDRFDVRYDYDEE